MNSHSRWTLYFKERFPIAPNFLVALGIVLSAKYCAESYYEQVTTPLSFLMALGGGMLFLAQIRFMDELKDVEKDRVAHPSRPLPRGLFSLKEFSMFIQWFNFAMVFWAIFAAFYINFDAGVWFAVGTGYLFLMFKEFFIGQRLQQYPMLYAISHQLIIFPMVAFVMACFTPPDAYSFWKTADCFYFGLLLLGAFFSFEVARKCDPDAHPILKTYLSIYGKGKTLLILTSVFSIASIAAVHLGFAPLVISLSVFCITVSSFLWVAPQSFKLIELFVSLYLLTCLWMIPIKVWWLGGLRP